MGKLYYCGGSGWKELSLSKFNKSISQDCTGAPGEAANCFKLPLLVWIIWEPGRALSDRSRANKHYMNYEELNPDNTYGLEPGSLYEISSSFIEDDIGMFIGMRWNQIDGAFLIRGRIIYLWTGNPQRTFRKIS